MQEELRYQDSNACNQARVIYDQVSSRNAEAQREDCAYLCCQIVGSGRVMQERVRLFSK